MKLDRAAVTPARDPEEELRSATDALDRGELDDEEFAAQIEKLHSEGLVDVSLIEECTGQASRA